MAAADKSASVSKQEHSDRRDEIDSGKEAAMDAYKKLLEAKEHFKKAAESAGFDWKGEAEAKLEKGKTKAAELCHDANTYLHDKPMATLGIAFAAGFLISQLMSRK